jgi:Bacterial toxin 37
MPGRVLLVDPGGSGKIPSNRLTNQRYGSATSPLPKHQVPNIPGSPATSLGPGWTWRGKPGEPIGGDKGAWFNPKTGETLHPDLGHGVSVGPHWDWRDPDGNFWRLFPDGRIKPRG